MKIRTFQKVTKICVYKKTISFIIYFISIVSIKYNFKEYSYSLLIIVHDCYLTTVDDCYLTTVDDLIQ